MSIYNKIAVITGGGGGIGKATAISLAKEKTNIVLFGGNNIEKLNKTSFFSLLLMQVIIN